MKIWHFLMTFVLLASAISSVTQAGATAISKDKANDYYASCLAKPDSRFTKDAQQAFCACSSAQVMRMMTAEDMGGMQTSQATQKKFMIDVNAPCLGDAVNDDLVARCPHDPQLSGANVEAVCGCAVKLTREWYDLSARTLMADALRRNPALTDPVAAVQDVPEFKIEAAKNVQACLKAP